MTDAQRQLNDVFAEMAELISILKDDYNSCFYGSFNIYCPQRFTPFINTIIIKQPRITKKAINVPLYKMHMRYCQAK